MKKITMWRFSLGLFFFIVITAHAQAMSGLSVHTSEFFSTSFTDGVIEPLSSLPATPPKVEPISTNLVASPSTPAIVAATTASSRVMGTIIEADFPLLTLIIFSPLFGVLLAIIFRDEKNGLHADVGTFFSSLITLGLTFYLVMNFDADVRGFQFVEKIPWIDRFGIHYHLGVDGFNLVMVALTAFLLPPALIATWATKRNKLSTEILPAGQYVRFLEGSWTFQIQIMFLQVGIFGAFLALDIFLFYTFFEVMLIPLYLMLGIWGGKNRIYAANKFFIYTIVGSLFMLASIIYIALLYYNTFGYWTFSILDWYQLSIPASEQIWLFTGLAFAFAIKTPMFPFHTWLPDAHYEAPTMGSVELAGLILKLGPYGLIRFVIPLFPAVLPTVGPILIVLGIIAILYAGFISMVQPKMKKLIAYSSVSHMGFIIIGIFVFNSQGLAGSLIQMVNHALFTGALFLCVGMLYQRTQTQEIVRYGGVIHKMPIFSAFFLFFSMASIGLPGLNGFVGEILVMIGAAQMNVYYAIFTALGVVIAAIYMLWMYQRIFFGKIKNHSIDALKDLTPRELLLLVPLAVSILVLGVYPQIFFDQVNTTIEVYLELVNADRLYAHR